MSLVVIIVTHRREMSIKTAIQSTRETIATWVLILLTLIGEIGALARTYLDRPKSGQHTDHIMEEANWLQNQNTILREQLEESRKEVAGLKDTLYAIKTCIAEGKVLTIDCTGAIVASNAEQEEDEGFYEEKTKSKRRVKP
jgi:5-bromo-4-chloroindolyl phosphate hydrolysis protein